jgi:hypothetical protein
MLLAGPVAVAGGDVPDIIDDVEGRPLWLAADVAVDAEGMLRQEVLGQRLPQILEAARLNTSRASYKRVPVTANAPSQTDDALDGCETFLGTIPEHFEPTASIDDLVTHSKSVVSGTISSVRQGFMGGLPGSLVRLSATYLTGSPAGETFLFYPLARIRTSDGFVCARPLGDFMAPQVGDRLLIFSMVQPHVLGDTTIFEVNIARELVHQSRDGVSRIPPALQTVVPDMPSFDTVEHAVRQFFKERAMRGEHERLP